MTRKLWVLATVTLFGVSAMLVGIGLTRNAAACDDAAKSAAATTSSSCCAKDGAKSASTDARKVHNAMIKSAVVAPGAAPILNAAAFGSMVTGADHASCDWCPEMTTAAVNAGHNGCAQMSAAECAAKMSSAECASKMSTTSAGCPAMGKSMATTASLDGSAYPVATTAGLSGHPACSGASVTIAAGGEGCSKSSNSASAAGHDGDKAAGGCCEGKSASAAGSGEKCATAKTASLKGKVDEMPYRESKRVTLAGSYACGHCTLNKTEDCSPMLKTADGKVYPLLQNSHAMEMRSKEGKNLEVSGTVKKVDGVKYLDVKSYKVM